MHICEIWLGKWDLRKSTIKVKLSPGPKDLQIPVKDMNRYSNFRACNREELLRNI